MSPVTNLQRQAYLGLMEDRFDIAELKTSLASAEQRVAAELQEYDARCLIEKRGVFREIADSFSRLF